MQNTVSNSSRAKPAGSARLWIALNPGEKLLGVGRYATVGLMGTLIDIGLFALLHIVFGVPILLANSIACCAGMLNNYFFHRYWTFAKRVHKPMGLQLFQFIVVSLSALTVNNLLVLWLAQPFALVFTLDATSDLLSKVTAQVISTFWNFFINHLWTFREPVKDLQQ